MDKIKNLLKTCNKCGNKEKLSFPAMQIGKTNFIVIGESPAKDGWIKSKIAFYNTEGNLQATGKILEKLLNGINLTIKDIYFTECCKCIIEDRNALNSCSKNCKPILLEQLKHIPCNTIVTLGLHPTEILLDKKINKISDYVGKTFNIVLNNKNYKLIPIYHPSPLNPKGYSGNIEIFKNIIKNC